MIASDYVDGGWLPAGRKMAEELGVGHVTYRKAVKFLEEEGILKSFPKKGHYVIPDYVRCKKIGFIFHVGNQLPFITEMPAVREAMGCLEERGYSAQIIQAALPEQLGDVAMANGMEGIIWFFPPPRVSEACDIIANSEEAPIVVICDYHFTQHSKAVAVSYDADSILLERAKFMLERGHRHIAYFGDYADAEKSGMVAFFNENGIPFTKEHCILDIFRATEQITNIVEQKQITGIISEGNLFFINCIFEELSKLPSDAQPEILISYSSKLDQIQKRYPKVRRIKMKRRISANLGRVATEMLLDHIENKTPLKTIKVGLED